MLLDFEQNRTINRHILPLVDVQRVVSHQRHLSRCAERTLEYSIGTAMLRLFAEFYQSLETGRMPRSSRLLVECSFLRTAAATLKSFQPDVSSSERRRCIVPWWSHWADGDVGSSNVADEKRSISSSFSSLRSFFLLLIARSRVKKFFSSCAFAHLEIEIFFFPEILIHSTRDQNDNDGTIHVLREREIKCWSPRRSDAVHREKGKKRGTMRRRSRRRRRRRKE